MLLCGRSVLGCGMCVCVCVCVCHYHRQQCYDVLNVCVCVCVKVPLEASHCIGWKADRAPPWIGGRDSGTPLSVTSLFHLSLALSRSLLPSLSLSLLLSLPPRSGERRVGRECRSLCSAY